MPLYNDHWEWGGGAKAHGCQPRGQGFKVTAEVLTAQPHQIPSTANLAKYLEKKEGTTINNEGVSIINHAK